jgi:hypothetical protein
MPTTSNFGWTTPADTDLVKDGASAIRTLGNGIDTSLVDLKGGTTGQVLSKASNTDLDFTWSSIDPLTILDAKGDLITATAADTPARLASSGVNGNILTVDTSTSTGLKWAAPTAAGANFSLLNSGGTALTGNTTITVSGISGQDKLFIMIDGASSANASANFRIRLNTDTNSNYTYSGAVYQSSIEPYGYTTTTGWIMATMSNNAISYMNGQMLISGCNSSGTKICQWSAATSASSGSGQQFVAAGGFYTGNTAITSVSIFSSNGNFDAGTIYIYGSA